jgi:hypothetical protein
VLQLTMLDRQVNLFKYGKLRVGKMDSDKAAPKGAFGICTIIQWGANHGAHAGLVSTTTAAPLDYACS